MVAPFVLGLNSPKSILWNGVTMWRHQPLGFYLFLYGDSSSDINFPFLLDNLHFQGLLISFMVYLIFFCIYCLIIKKCDIVQFLLVGDTVAQDAFSIGTAFCRR